MKMKDIIRTRQHRLERQNVRRGRAVAIAKRRARQHRSAEAQSKAYHAVSAKAHLPHEVRSRSPRPNRHFLPGDVA